MVEIENSFAAEEPVKPTIHKGKTISKLRIRKMPNGKVVRIVPKNTILEWEHTNAEWLQLTDGNYCLKEFVVEMD